MAPKYAKDQPAGFTNRIERVAIVGASGQIGTPLATALVKTGKHTVTALTRQGSKNEVPPGVKAVPVDYNDESSVISALRGQQFLIITLSGFAPPDVHSKIVQAAAKAGVPHIMPNIFGIDDSNEALTSENPLSADIKGITADIEAADLSYTYLICSLWYEYSLAMGPLWFGFDFANKKLTLYDDGTTKVNLTTWEQCGRAVAALLSLKELPEDANDTSLTVDSWRNKPLVISSFLVSQLDMFESWKRITGDKDSDWTIEKVPSKERYQQGIEAMKNAQDPMSGRMGAAMASFVRIFYPNGGGDYESTRGLDNDKLGLPKEDFDERTAVAKQMVDDGYAAKLFAKAAGSS
ncbi:NAD(P)-binding protein [Zopfia rhizophila CBS 207.26]|uniref:NAD(P)-binding protein n=1 Tax=Zopfia rhizophila CBS 207.26 TaxID=1314779 RepID=A0A6A6EQ93_9PEZI|nr:NAD(P)-binding protein [Zopfia rhizophila CBS 207.26]